MCMLGVYEDRTAILSWFYRLVLFYFAMLLGQT